MTPEQIEKWALAAAEVDPWYGPKWRTEFARLVAADLTRKRDAARATLDATCSPDAFNDLVRQRTKLIAERDAARDALRVCVNLLEIWSKWTPDYCTAHRDFESLPEIANARAILEAKT